MNLEGKVTHFILFFIVKSIGVQLTRRKNSSGYLLVKYSCTEYIENRGNYEAISRYTVHHEITAALQMRLERFSLERILLYFISPNGSRYVKFSLEFKKYTSESVWTYKFDGGNDNK